MKVRKAIKRIAAVGIGASMMGATLMGASAADLSDYPNMFIKDGMFDGLLVVGDGASTTDTIGVTNIALGLQKAAVTKTMVCGSATASRTSVTGEKLLIEKTGDELNINEDLEDIQDTALDDGDLPSILGDGTYDENEGETDNDVTYTQEIELLDGSGQVVYEQDDDDAPEADIYLKFPKNTPMYNFTLEFDSDGAEYDASDSCAECDDDFKSTSIDIQGQTYTITKAEFDGSDELDKLTMLVGESVTWIAEGKTISEEVDGVEHTITMVDVASSSGESECGFEVDGSTIWIGVDETKTISGLTLGVTNALEVNSDKSDTDQCRVYLGAEELILTEGSDGVEVGGDEVEGSIVDFTSTVSGDDGAWEKLVISYEPEEDEFLSAGDEFIDPIFGNFKFIMGGEVVVREDVEFSASGATATLNFVNFEGDDVEVPFALDEDTGNIVLGDDEDLTASGNPGEGFYLEGDTCTGGANDLTDCEGAKFLAVTSGDVAHVIEITKIDESDLEMSFDDVTTGGSTDNEDYSNSGATTFSLGSGVGDVTLTINAAAGTIAFTDIELGTGVIKTEYEAIVSFTDSDTVVVTENDEESNHASVTVDLAAGAGSDNDTIEIQSPALACVGGSCTAVVENVDFSDDDDDTKMSATEYGSLVQYDSDNEDSLMIMHPEEQLYVDVFVAATDSTTMEVEGSDGDCMTSTQINPIPSTVNMLDTKVSNPSAQNLITVGGPCANSVTATLLGNPEVCYAGFEQGKAMIKLVAGSGDNVALIVAGATGQDTQLASIILQEYEDYELSGMEMEATTVSQSGLKVAPKVATAPAEEMDDEMDDEMADEE